MVKTPKMTEAEIEVQMAAARQELLEENTRNFSSAARVAKTFFKVDKPTVEQVLGTLEIMVTSDGSCIDEATVLAVLDQARYERDKKFGGGDDGDIFAFASILLGGTEATDALARAEALAKQCAGPVSAETVLAIYDHLMPPAADDDLN